MRPEIFEGEMQDLPMWVCLKTHPVRLPDNESIPRTQVQIVRFTIAVNFDRNAPVLARIKQPGVAQIEAGLDESTVVLQADLTG